MIIAAGCEFITHDIFYHVLNLDYAHLGKFYPHFKPIVIEDNVCIGGFSKIMPGVKGSKSGGIPSSPGVASSPKTSPRA